MTSYFTGRLSSPCASGGEHHGYCYGWFWNAWNEKQRCECDACGCNEETI